MKRMGAVLAACALLAACNPRPPAPAPSTSPTVEPSPTPSGLPALIVNGQGRAGQPVRFVQSTKENRVQYEVTARSFHGNGAPGTEKIDLSQVHVIFHGKDGSVLEADAPKASIDQQANTVELTGGVRAHNSAGTTLSCDSLLYDRTTEMLHGVGHVAIANPNGFRGTGSRFDSDITLTHTQML
jgi:LPS export ABC transporter protein LptC